jgi:hypothetical protein
VHRGTHDTCLYIAQRIELSFAIPMSGAAFRRFQLVAPEDDRSLAQTARSATASPSTYSGALIGLLCRLWLELEGIVGELSARDMPHASCGAENQMEIFRLEVLVLVDACDSLRWQSLMNSHQRLGLRATLHTLLRTLTGPRDLSDSEIIGHAQNQLFDSLLRHHIEREHSRPPRSATPGKADCNPIAIY